MTKTTVTEKFDAEGNIYERVTVTEEVTPPTPVYNPGGTIQYPGRMVKRGYPWRLYNET